MNIFQAASLPAPTPNRTNTGVAGYVQAPPATSDYVISKQDTSSKDEFHEVPSAEHLAQAIKQVNGSFAQRGQNLYASFEKDKITGINMVKIVDKKTNETISQMPPKELVEFARIIELPQGWRGQLIYDRA